ncbi:MAG: hypothetical protein M2R45_04856 [Verrucomicrobia subdivision 3 bacterium]|nr:hypothetical protein [Limisphaerales bacterium]MCS1417537.1 hypothetical protein [Limisphaerales bacterium]
MPSCRGAGGCEALGFQRSIASKSEYKKTPPPARDYRRLATRVVNLHPLTIAQNARPSSGGGNISLVPTKAIRVGPEETWKADKVSIWHAGARGNAFGQRLTTLMITKRLIDSSVLMSLLGTTRMCSSIFIAEGLAIAKLRCINSASDAL